MTTDHEWRMCACERTRPAHTDAAPDPADGTGCGMAWRTTGQASTEIEERHITEAQLGGHLRQDAPAELALPNHQMSSEENAMVGPRRPEVVTLCGSMRFLPLMLQVAAEETAAGAIVLAPFAVVAAAEQGGAVKARLDELHRHKIDMADRVIVVSDPSGYYGASTAREITYARVLGKPVERRRVSALGMTVACIFTGNRGVVVEPGPRDSSPLRDDMLLVVWRDGRRHWVLPDDVQVVAVGKRQPATGGGRS
jgi:hypothetical protein